MTAANVEMEINEPQETIIQQQFVTPTIPASSKKRGRESKTKTKPDDRTLFEQESSGTESDSDLETLNNNATENALYNTLVRRMLKKDKIISELSARVDALTKRLITIPLPLVV